MITTCIKRRACLLAAAALLCIAQWSFAAPPQVTGALETVEGIRVLKLWGTAEERGHAHGYLLGAGLIEGFEDIVLHERILEQPGDYETKVRGKLLGGFRFTPEHRAEFEGMLRGITDAVGEEGLRLERLGRDMDVKDLMAINTLADWYPFACSSFSAWGEATENGELITARNLDYMAFGALIDMHLIIAYTEPGSGRQPWVTVSWPGLIGAYSAMNAEGVTISMHDSSPLQPIQAAKFVPRSIALRNAIETAGAATALADVRGVLLKSPSMMGNNVHVSSPYTGQEHPAGVLEYDGNRSKDGGVTQRVSEAKPTPCWLACTNHYCLRSQPPAMQDHPFDTARRFSTISDALAGRLESQNKIDPGVARQIIGSVAADGNVLTLHTVIYLPNRKEMHVCFARPQVPAPQATPVRLRMVDLLQR
jgi:hypothetical protein